MLTLTALTIVQNQPSPDQGSSNALLLLLLAIGVLIIIGRLLAKEIGALAVVAAAAVAGIFSTLRTLIAVLLAILLLLGLAFVTRDKDVLGMSPSPSADEFGLPGIALERADRRPFREVEQWRAC